MDRGRIHFVDVLMVFATLLTFVTLSTAFWPAIQNAITYVDPLSGQLLRLTLSFFVIAIIGSFYVSAVTQ